MLKTVSKLGAPRKETLNSLSSLIKGSQKNLFAFGEEQILLEALEENGIVDYCVTFPTFPLADLMNLAREEKFSDEEKSFLQISILVLENAHTRIRHEMEVENESEEEEPDEQAEDDDENSMNKLKALLSYMLEKYTFKSELEKLFKKFVGKNIKVKKAHNLSKKTAEAAAEKWENTKENLRAFFALIGLDGIFVVIEVLMKRSKTFELFMKTMGSFIFPIFAVIYAMWLGAKWLANPLERLAKWVADIVDFRIPGTNDDDA